MRQEAFREVHDQQLPDESGLTWPSVADRPLRVLHHPLNIAGGPGSLSAGMRALGVESDLWIFREQPFKRGSDRNLGLRQAGGAAALAANLPRQFAAFAQALGRYDVFHCHFALTLVPKRVAVPAIRRTGRGLVVHFWGSDIRDKPASAVSYLLEHAHAAILGSVHVRRRAPQGPWRYHVVPPAIDTDLWQPQIPDPGRTIRIVHAPSRRRQKGTEAVLDAVATLKAAGAPIELDLVENTPNAEARLRYAAADLIVDQLGVGWYGLFATESMALGKPVVCRLDADPAREHEEHFGVELPLVRADRETLTDVLRGLVSAPERLAEIGRRSREYAVALHDSRSVARRVLDIYGQVGLERAVR